MTDPPGDSLLACLALLTDPEMTDEGREAFYAVIAATSTGEAAEEVRRLVEFFRSDGPEPPVDIAPPPDPRAPWDD